MYLALENGHLLNIDMVSNVEFREIGEHAGKAICWGYGVILAAESKVAFDYFYPIYRAAIDQREKNKIQPGQG